MSLVILFHKTSLGHWEFLLFVSVVHVYTITYPSYIYMLAYCLLTDASLRDTKNKVSQSPAIVEVKAKVF